MCILRSLCIVWLLISRIFELNGADDARRKRSSHRSLLSLHCSLQHQSGKLAPWRCVQMLSRSLKMTHLSICLSWWVGIWANIFKKYFNRFCLKQVYIGLTKSTTFFCISSLFFDELSLKWPNNYVTNNKKLWSSGHTRKLIFKRPWVQIPATRN